MLSLALAMIAAQTAAAGSAAAPQSLLQNCDAHKFETIVEATVDGLPKRSRVRLCGTEGQSDADWVRTLKDAAEKAEANTQLTKPMRDQIVAALNAEIARLEAPLPSTRAPAAGGSLEGYSVLPALPAPRQAAPASPMRDYAALPPLPTKPTAPVKVLGGAAGAVVPLLAAPKLSFSCFNPSDIAGEGPCTGFERDTMLTVRAGEKLPPGTSLRFVRDGTERAEVELAQLQRGKSARFAMPADVCSHASGGTLEIRVVRSTRETGPEGQVVAKDGPYNLRC
jgi:hypothetical protein